MRQRVITAVVALVLFIPILYVGGMLLEVVAAALAGIAVYELFRMKGLAILSFEGVLAILGAVFLVLPMNRWLPFLKGTNSSFLFFYLVVMVILGFSVISKNTYTIEEAGFPIVVSLYASVGFQSLVAARTANIVILLYALCVVWATDIGAYMAGRRFGNRKLWPEISPNKTVEGSLGGIASAVVISLLFYLIKPQVFSYNLLVMLILTVIFSVVGQFGDLVESAIKRHYGVKDSGTILPGHGGILDRFDSMLFVFPIMALFGLF